MSTGVGDGGQVPQPDRLARADEAVALAAAQRIIVIIIIVEDNI